MSYFKSQILFLALISLASVICQCDDCDTTGISIQQLMDKNSDFQNFEIEQNEKKIFYLMNNDSSVEQLKVNLIIQDFVTLKVFETNFNQAPKSERILSPYSIAKYNSYKFDLSTIQADKSIILVFINDSNKSLNLSVQFETSNDDSEDNQIFSLKNSTSIVIITIIILVSLVFLVLVFLTIRHLVSQYRQNKVVQFQQEQKTLQINNKIPVQKYEVVVKKYPNLRSCNECSVCLEEFKTKDDVRVTPCFHIYHQECFNLWANSTKEALCPVCRRSIQEGEKEVDDYKLKMQASQVVPESSPTQNVNDQSTNQQSNQNNINDIENQIQNPMPSRDEVQSNENNTQVAQEQASNNV